MSGRSHGADPAPGKSYPKWPRSRPRRLLRLKTILTVSVWTVSSRTHLISIGYAVRKLALRLRVSLQVRTHSEESEDQIVMKNYKYFLALSIFFVPNFAHAEDYNTCMSRCINSSGGLRGWAQCQPICYQSFVSGGTPRFLRINDEENNCDESSPPEKVEDSNDSKDI